MHHLKKSALMAGIACIVALPGVASAQDELIEASTIIGSNMSNGLNTFGTVENILLDENGRAMEYVLFETSDTFTPTQDDRGFVEIASVEFAPGDSGELELVVEDTGAQRKPQELKVTRSEADHRLLSNVMDQTIQFSDHARAIEDVLINRNTGEIEYFTVAMDSDGIFDQEVRAIPAGEVDISSGEVKVALSLAELESDDKYRLGSFQESLQ